MFFKNKRKRHQEDLNQKVSKYQKWWQDQTGEFPFSGSNPKRNTKSPQLRLKEGKGEKTLDDSFVYYEMD